jgi:hypothetical protein
VAISNGGDNYFPTIACDSEGNRLFAGWFTNQFDGDFRNRSDVELVRLNDDGTAKSGRRLARPSNEPEADPLLGGFFIGDYIEVFAHDRTAWVGYNANYRSRAVLFEGPPIPQQDKLPGQGAGVAVAWLGRGRRNARGGLRQPEQVGTASGPHLPPHRLGANAPRRETDPPPD